MTVRLGIAGVLLMSAAIAGQGTASARQQEQAPRATAPHVAVFTAAQAEAGKAAYAQHCASCHMPDLSGSNEMAALKGEPFLATWSPRTTKALFDYISASMPYGGKSLTVQAYVEITAFLLQSNGAAAGDSPLTPATDARIDTLALRR